jgi:AcrR family transcriptional regulator
MTVKPDAGPDVEKSVRERILDGTFAVLSRNGRSKLSLSDVAAEASVSRRTLYRWFSSKEVLLDAFSLHEEHSFDAGLAAAVEGLDPPARLDAVLRFIVEYQHSYSLVPMAEVEPEYTLLQTSRVIPIMRHRIQQLLSGTITEIAAATVVRVAVSHYLVSSDDREQFLAQLRQAAGIGP